MVMGEELAAAKVDLARLKSDNPGPEAKADADEEKAKAAREELARVQDELATTKGRLGSVQESRDRWKKASDDRDVIIAGRDKDVRELNKENKSLVDELNATDEMLHRETRALLKK